MRRSLTAGTLAAIAGIHIALVPDHLREAPYAAALFIALSAAAIAIAILLVLRANQLTYIAGGALALTALLAYVASRSVGLPSLGDDVGDWLNPLGLSALICESAAAILTLSASPAPRLSRNPPRPGGGTRALRRGRVADHRTPTTAGRISNNDVTQTRHAQLWAVGWVREGTPDPEA